MELISYLGEFLLLVNNASGENEPYEKYEEVRHAKSVPGR